MACYLVMAGPARFCTDDLTDVALAENDNKPAAAATGRGWTAMSLQVRRTIPLYRKLLLENKILLFFALLLVLLSAAVFLAVHWTTSRIVSEIAHERAAGSLAPGVEVDGAAVTAIDEENIDRFATRAAWLAVAGMAVPGLFLFGAGRFAIRHAVRPVRELTRIADEISTGNLDPRLDFGIHVNCWEIKNCQRTDCGAYQNFSEQCWYIDGTPCEGYEPRFPQKLQGCRSCEVYQAHRGDEVVQLADAFRHMTNVLKASRADLVNSSDFQKRLIQNSFDGIVATSGDGIVTIFNRVAENLTGYSRKEVIGIKRWQDLFEARLEKIMDIPLSHEPVRRLRGFPPRESVVKRVNGERVDVHLAGVSLYESGMHIGNVFFFQDMREIKRLREDLIQSERLAAAGQAAAGISHSIRNILDGLGGGVYVYKAGKKRGDEQKMDTGWDMIERNVEIISDLVTDLLNFAKERAPEYAAIDPRDLIADVVANLGLREDGPLRIEIESDGSPDTVTLDRHAFGQCLGNLLRNATEAYEEGEEGTITVSVEGRDEMVVFTVRDDGMGMSRHTLEKIKSGMYSTKGSKGTGLGLQVVQKIVSEHHGTLTIESEEGHGSTFRIEIPAGEIPASA